MAKSPATVPILLSLLMISQVIAGCGGIGPGNPNASLSSDRDIVNQGEAVNFDARDSTTPDPTIIDEYRWDFGDGEIRTTKQGVISHIFDGSGTFDVKVEVFNDEGGSDSASMLIIVNAIPHIVLNLPDYVKSGQEARMDASGSFDPEGGAVDVTWDFDSTQDSDGDSDPLNDVDASGPITSLVTSQATNISGTVTVVDDSGGSNTTTWNLRVISRTFRIIWEERHVDYDWSGYLEQGQTEEIQFQPGDGSRLIDFTSTLTLSRDILPIMWPEDNFTLGVDVPSSGWSFSVITTQDNITENSSAVLERSSMNPVPESDYTVFANSKQEVEMQLLNDPNGRFGQGNWNFLVTALECDPDTPVDGIDPDQGNDWSLQARFVILVLRVSEISV